MKVFAQIIGIIAMAINVCSFQVKEQKKIIAMQFVGSILFAANMLLLGAVAGGLMNFAGIIRGFVFLNKKSLGKLKWVLTGGLIMLYTAMYILTFAVFGKAPTKTNLFLEILPVFAMIVMTFGFAVDSAKATRITGFINSPPWLVYNLANGTIGGIICEIFCMTSTLTAIWRFDIRRKENDKV